MHLIFNSQILLDTNLDFPFAVVHHAVMCRHGFVGMERGGVEGHLFNFGDAPDGVGLTGASGRILVFPVAEKLLEQSGLSSSRQHLDL